jgi:hypothetical protein
MMMSGCIFRVEFIFTIYVTFLCDLSYLLRLENDDGTFLYTHIQLQDLRSYLIGLTW